MLSIEKCSLHFYLCLILFCVKWIVAHEFVIEHLSQYQDHSHLPLKDLNPDILRCSKAQKDLIQTSNVT